ncbi:MAG TPA: outer membrane beta-barrel protein [Usitatibacter sp.]|nr:outer membrane beta-barrel protein [Usitatibacter sp.]
MAILAAVAAASPASALFNDRLELWAAENVTHDTNVLRLSKSLSPQSVGATQRSDTIYTTHVGATANVPVSQQLFVAEYTRYRSQYRYFKDLNFTGHTARAHWQWVWGQDKNGTLGYVESEGLSAFSNIQARAPDLVISRQAYWTGGWLFTPRWRANGALTAAEVRHSDPARKPNDLDTQVGELGLSHITPLDNSIGIFSRYEHGQIPSAVPLAGFPAGFDNEYQQYGMGGAIVWVPAGHSRFVGRVEGVHREYKQATQRNFRGPILRVLYTWTPTSKLTILSALNRDVGPAEEIQTSFVLVTGGYIRPRWQVTEKVAVQGNMEYNRYAYHGDRSIVGANFSHRVWTVGAKADYRPTTKILLSAGVNREVRASDLATGDYEVTVGFVEGRIGF